MMHAQGREAYNIYAHAKDSNDYQRFFKVEKLKNS
jgi:hypothetical protein